MAGKKSKKNGGKAAKAAAKRERAPKPDGGAARSAGSDKLPKTIAGVRVPKTLREPGGKLLKAVRDPVMVDLAAAALAAAANGLAEGMRRRAGSLPASPARGATAGAGLGSLFTAVALESVRRLGENASERPAASGKGRDGDRA